MSNYESNFGQALLLAAALLLAGLLIVGTDESHVATQSAAYDSTVVPIKEAIGL